MKKLIPLLIILIATVLPVAADSSWHLDLNSVPVFVKVGFDQSDISHYPSKTDNRWTVFPAAEEKGRLVRAIDLDSTLVPKPVFLSMKDIKEKNFTYSIPFDMSLPDNNEVPGIHFGALGDNWRIYLNGNLIQSSVHLNSDGRIKTHTSRRDVHFPINASFFNNGKNLLVIHIISDPTRDTSGLYLTNPYYIDTYETINNSNSSLLTIAFLAIYLFMGIYHIFLYSTGRKNRYNLFYGLFSIILFLYLLVRTRFIYNIIPDSDLIFKIELICLFGILPTVSAFFEMITENKMSKITRFFFLYNSLLAIVVAFTPTGFSSDVLLIWQMTGLLMILYIYFYLISWKFYSTTSRLWKMQSTQPNPKSRITVFFLTVKDTAVGNLFIGSTILGATAVYDILDSMFFKHDLVLTNYGFFVFTLGSAFIIANRFTFLSRQMQDLNQSLELKVKEVETASEKMELSERKYRSLFEGSTDAVLLLDEELNILEGNDNGFKFLGINRITSNKTSFLEALSREGVDNTHSQDILRLKFSELLQTEKPSEMNLKISGKMGEQKNVRLRLELINTLSKGRQILFRAVQIQEDILLDYFKGARYHYQISNSFPLTEEVSRRITANLERYLDKSEAGILYIGIREIIINAVEHGNLDINFEEKTKAQESGRYIDFLIERQNEPKYRHKKVHVEASINPKKAMFRISDEGPGFDHKTFLEKTRHQVSESLSHGRGISMALQLFDKVTYNEKGNQVTLIKEI